MSLAVFLKQIEGLVNRESEVDHAKKSEDHELIVNQINSSVTNIDDIIGKLQVVRANLLTIKEQVTNPSAQARSIYETLDTTSNYQQVI